MQRTPSQRLGSFLAVLTVVVVVTGSLAAQQNPIVVEVEVVGNKVTTSSFILGVTSIAKGSPLTPTGVQETVRRLYKLGLFSDVRIDAAEVTGGLKVSIVVTELPKLAGLEFKGNKKIDSKEFREKLRLGVGGYISPYLIALKKQEIKDLYAAKGYFRADVAPDLAYNADSSEATLTYRIDEKSKVKVERVELSGAVRVPAKDLIGKMRNRKRGFLRSSDFALEKYEEDLTKIIEEYHKRGFIDAYMVSDSTHIDSAANTMAIYLNVYEGPLYYFGKTTFANTQVVAPDRLSHVLKHREGEIFDSEKYEKSLYEIYTAYQDIGHLHVRVLDQRATRSDSVIDISYEITEGLPSHINLVRIVGNNKTKDHVIRREITSLPGQVFNRALLIRSVRDVMALNFFSNVMPTPIDLPNGDVDVEFKVEEKQTGQISAGAGYNSQDKLVGSVGMGIPNLAGNGQNLSFNIDFGSRRSSFSLSFTEPWLFGRPTLLGTDLYLSNRRWYDDYTEGRQGGSIRLGRRLRWPDNYFRAYASYRLERNRFYDYDDTFEKANRYKSTYYADTFEPDNGVLNVGQDSLITQALHGPYPGSVVFYDEKWQTASRLSFTIRRDSRDLPEFATRGSDFSYTFENTGGFLGGYWNYQKHLISAAHFIPLFWNWAIAARVQYGVVTSPDGDDRILVSDRFNPGGVAYDGVVRGYDDGTLTPDSLVTQSDTLFLYDTTVVGPGAIPDDTLFSSFRTRVRGKYMLVTNLELQIPILKQQLYGLAFFDAGNAWLRREDIKPLSNLYRGAGLGFRIAVPGIGTLGFDFAYPLDEISGQSKGWKPHFQIGTTFK